MTISELYSRGAKLDIASHMGKLRRAKGFGKHLIALYDVRMTLGRLWFWSRSVGAGSSRRRRKEAAQPAGGPGQSRGVRDRPPAFIRSVP